jgi:hypothetical protein
VIKAKPQLDELGFCFIVFAKGDGLTPKDQPV